MKCLGMRRDSKVAGANAQRFLRRLESETEKGNGEMLQVVKDDWVEATKDCVVPGFGEQAPRICSEILAANA